MDRKQIIKGLECCSDNRGAQNCYGCPYAFLDIGDDCSDQLMKDAAKALKEKQDERPRW